MIKMLGVLIFMFGAASGLIIKANNYTSRTNLVCKDHPIHCDYYWSRGWYTCKTGGALWEFCPESCGLCGDKGCQDRHRSCGILKKFGYCVKYARNMKQKCGKACGFCQVKLTKPKLESGCRDYESDCPKWKSFGECSKSKDTIKYCPKSCGKCGEKLRVQPPKLSYKRCEDLKPSACKKPYFCARSTDFATKYCRETCKMCVKSGTCYDRSSLCYWYKHKGFCKINSYYYRDIATRCPLSCGLCNP